MRFAQENTVDHSIEKTFLEMNDMNEYISFTKFPIDCKWIKTQI